MSEGREKTHHSAHAVGGRHEVARIEDQLRRSFEGEAWHGPSLMELLREVPVDVAPAKPLEHAHSIWEIVLHITAWQNAVAKRLPGEVVELSAQQDWPAVSDFDEAAWKEALRALNQSYKTLAAAIAKLNDSDLSRQAPGRKHDLYVLLHGIVQHNLYHAGQIALLKKSSR
jgi:uncharacterized damage-inducible protein DinB